MFFLPFFQTFDTMSEPSHSSTSAPPEPSDSELIEAIVKGNSQLFDALVTRYKNLVFRFILKHIDNPDIAQDLSQDTFLAAYQNLKTFRSDAKFSTWLLGIARNKILNDINRAGKKRSRLVTDEVLNKHQSKENNPFQEVEKRQTLSSLQTAINELGDDLREVVVSVSMEGLSYEEVSNIMEIPVGTVKSKLFRARTILKDKLKNFRK